MNLYHTTAPARRLFVCAGVLFCCLSACSKDNGKVKAGASGDRTLELTGDTVDLPKGVTLHDVVVKFNTSSDFAPQSTTAKQGDVVRFTTDDTRTHALEITAPTDQARQALESSGQRRSPPLVSKGQAWVVSLKGIPAGTYTVSCISHGGTASIIVQ